MYYKWRSWRLYILFHLIFWNKNCMNNHVVVTWNASPETHAKRKKRKKNGSIYDEAKEKFPCELIRSTPVTNTTCNKIKLLVHCDVLEHWLNILWKTSCMRNHYKKEHEAYHFSYPSVFSQSFCYQQLTK